MQRVCVKRAPILSSVITSDIFLNTILKNINECVAQLDEHKPSKFADAGSNPVTLFAGQQQMQLVAEDLSLGFLTAFSILI